LIKKEGGEHGKFIKTWVTAVQAVQYDVDLQDALGLILFGDIREGLQRLKTDEKRRAPVYLLLDGADYTYTDYQGSIEPLLFVFVERRLREFYKRADKTRGLTDPVKRDHTFWELNNDYRKLKELVNEIIRLDDAWEDFRNRRKT
jgi:hypothetical protein